MFYDRLFCAASANLTLIANPKAGATTLKKSLAPELGDDLHKQARRLLPPPKSTDTVFFAVTRNPYSRALSCYKDKFTRDNPVRRAFFKKYQLRTTEPLGFTGFLETLARDPNRQAMNPHYRPQTYNLLSEHITPSYLGRIERPEQLAEFLSNHNFKLIKQAPHATGSAASYKSEISSHQAALILKIYKDDFRQFGYSIDLNSDFVPEDVFSTQQTSPLTNLFFALYSAGWTRATLIRAANKYRDDHDIDKAKLFFQAVALFKGDHR